MKKISTTQLSKVLNIDTKNLFDILSKESLIIKEGKVWKLTSKGKDFGGSIQVSQRYGNYIVWNEDFNPIEKFHQEENILITSSEIANEFKITASKVNKIMLEIGFLERTIKGWNLTQIGRSIEQHSNKY